MFLPHLARTVGSGEQVQHGGLETGDLQEDPGRDRKGGERPKRARRSGRTDRPGEKKKRRRGPLSEYLIVKVIKSNNITLRNLLHPREPNGEGPPTRSPQAGMGPDPDQSEHTADRTSLKNSLFSLWQKI